MRQSLLYGFNTLYQSERIICWRRATPFSGFFNKTRQGYHPQIGGLLIVYGEVMFGLITALANPVLSLISTAFSRYNERKTAENTTYLKIEEAKQKLAATQVEFGHKLRLEQLKATPKWFKIFTFISWALPMYITVGFPEYGALIFKNLEIMPDWYVQSYIILMFTVWGVAISKETVTSLFSNFLEDYRLRKEIKYKSFTDKTLYDIIRAKSGKLSQEEVDTINRILDK